jgi:tetratricopeptide (TPR) repeat protein
MAGFWLLGWLILGSLGSEAVGGTAVESLQRGLDLLQKGQLEEAEQQFQQALRLSQDPKTKAQAFLGIGRVLHTQGQLKEARAKYEEAFRLAPDAEMKTLALNNIGEILRIQGQLEEARAK